MSPKIRAARQSVAMIARPATLMTPFCCRRRQPACPWLGRRRSGGIGPARRKPPGIPRRRLSHESLSAEPPSVSEVISVITSRFRGTDGNVVDERAFAQRHNRFMQQPGAVDTARIAPGEGARPRHIPDGGSRG